MTSTLLYQTNARTSPPTPSILAFLSVIIPFDVEIIATPRPPSTLGISSLPAYTLKPGLLILFIPVITFCLFQNILKLLL